MSIFKNYAQYYDLLYRDKNYIQEAKFVKKLISKYSKTASTILELGCGTGLHAIALAKLGYSIDGIDLSSKMLDIAENKINAIPPKLKSKISLTLSDIRDFNSPKKYDTVISLFHVISYMSTNADLQSFFTTASKHLLPNGLLIFDCWYGPTVLTDRPTARVKNLEDEKLKVVRQATPEMFPNLNIVKVNYDVLATSKTSAKTEKYHESHTMRYLFTPEIELFLKNNGFELLDSLEWLTGKKPGFDTWGVCFVARLIA